ATAPTIVTSSPSRIQTVPRPMTIRQWNRDHGSRSSRAGTLVVTTPSSAVVVMPCLLVQRHGLLPGVEQNRPEWAGPSRVSSVLRCRLLGHRYRFLNEGDTMVWHCARECGAKGSKRYPTPQDAERYARAFDREDLADLGRRAPLGLLPLR